MRNKRLLTMLSTAAITALAALSVPATFVTAQAAPAAKAAAKRQDHQQRLHRAARRAARGRLRRRHQGACRPPGRRKGEKIDPYSPAVVNYRNFLESRQEAVLAAVGGGNKLYSYGYVFNGFAAELTSEQAAKLARPRACSR